MFSFFTGKDTAIITLKEAILAVHCNTRNVLFLGNEFHEHLIPNYCTVMAHNRGM